MLKNLNWIDYTIIAIILLSALISLMRGFLREAISLATWIVAFWVGFTFATKLTPYLVNYIHNDSVRYGIAFVILFLIVLLLGAVVNFTITHLVEKTGLSGTDRLLGVFFGLARGVLFIAILLLAAKLTVFPESPTWKQSVLIPKLMPIETWLAQYIPKDLADQITNKVLSNTKSASQSNSPSTNKPTADNNMLNQAQEGK